jgi:Salmonella virulence plasmid 65kDa B protein/Insecticide toxin TcdB middle/C-terminal region/Insecticide toxin TcdB middle/N-terminal region
MQNDSSVSVQKLALPKGGGAIVGLGESLAPVGPTGMAEFSLPLPISPGRGYAPVLTLNYSSGVGNGPFGLGWNLGATTVQRRTDRGVPRYDGSAEDEFVGPDGEVLVSERDSGGKTITTTVDKYGDKSLGASYQVTRYFPRVEGHFNRIERWQGAGAADDFWLIHGADGQLHCLGKTAGARVAHPDYPERIAQWHIEESVNPEGEHIYYRYVAENTDNVTADNENNRGHSANHYLAEVYYGNRTSAADLYLWGMTDASGQGWLFSVVLDYGERGVDLDKPPPYADPTDNKWPLRADSFSRYEFGFEVRTHRLCRQILMFHHFPNELKEDHTLVRRWLLTHRESPIVSHLVQVRTVAYEADGTVQSMPPLELGYSTFDATQLTSDYQVFDGIAELNDGVHYQMVDLYGDGVPGILFRHGDGWRYRQPVRGRPGTDDIAYDAWRLLPAVPSMQPVRIALMDIDGDGRLDWLVTQPGLSGCFSLKEGNQWSSFTPFTALPIEFFHPQAQMANLVGAGLSDLALIGPKSVRLYANQRDGFSAATEVAHDVDDSDTGLPIAGRDKRELVAFSDVLGSGQPHLVRIRHDGVTCWPNLGRGNFGKPIRIAVLDFDCDTFNPDQVFLADLDGSGAADLIYVEHDQLTLYMNESGNGLAAPITLQLPQGLTFDRLCHVSFPDLQGLGVASLVISHRHMNPRHWRLDFTHVKPYLLTSINNNMGAGTTLSYRSSVQYWLDDKAANPILTSALPMPIQTLAQVTTLDEITGNSVTQLHSFHRGVYDGIEREFRGFAYVLAQDAQQVASTVKSDVPIAPPLVTKTWFHSGREVDESNLFGSPYEDTNAIVVGPTRLTRYDSTNNEDTELVSVDATTRFWLFRALKGHPLRQETYGLDGSANQDVPYAVSTWRYQVRCFQPPADHASPVVLPGTLEQVSYHYERIAVDPMVSQQVLLRRDLYGSVTWQTSVNYPRRLKPETNPYPSSLPASSWASSYDDQQETLVLTERCDKPIHLDEDPQAWRLGLPCQQRGNVLTYDRGQVPAGGLNFEALTQGGGLLDAGRPRTYGGQHLTVYTSSPPLLTALVDHVESAEFDDAALEAFDGVLDDAARDTLLGQAGYVLADRILPPGQDAEPQVWVARRGYTAYQPASAFYRPSQQQSSLLTGPVKYDYDDYVCALTKTTDAVGNQTTAEYDYRFLHPASIVDMNGNTHEVLLDALGRVVADSFYGTEQGVAVGFAPVASFSPKGLTVPQIIQEAGGTTKQQVASIQFEDAFSWIGQLTQASLGSVTSDVPGLWSALQAHGFITADGWILAAGRAWAAGTQALPDISDQVRPVILAAGQSRMPVQSATLIADRYPSDAAQQVRVTVAYFDGLGRALQQVMKTPAGPAWQRDPQGEIVVGQNGIPVTADASSRWAVSGKVEYDNKGQPVRSYQPYHINDWRYVDDKAMRTCGYADTHCYDAIGRETEVLTAKNYVRRNSYFPWFTVAEDENDTWSGDPPVKVGSVVFYADPDEVPADGTTPIVGTATVTISGTTPVPDGTLVTFAASNGATPAPVTCGTLNGIATTGITSTMVGDSKVTATAGDVTSASAMVHFATPAQALQCKSVALTILHNHSIPADGYHSVTLQVTTYSDDAQQKPLPGVAVTIADFFQNVPFQLTFSNNPLTTGAAGTATCDVSGSSETSFWNWNWLLFAYHTADIKSSSVQINFAPARQYTVTISQYPAEMKPSDKRTVSGTLTDSGGDFVPSAQCSISCGNPVYSIEAATTTNSKGEFSFDVSAYAPKYQGQPCATPYVTVLYVGSDGSGYDERNISVDGWSS